MARKTISIDRDIEQMLRDIQSKFIKADTKSWSLSKIVNLVLISAIINSNDLTINDWNKIRSYITGRQVDFADADTERFVNNIVHLKIAS